MDVVFTPFFMLYNIFKCINRNHIMIALNTIAYMAVKLAIRIIRDRMA